jgi:hypothetical protein
MATKQEQLRKKVDINPKGVLKGVKKREQEMKRQMDDPYGPPPKGKRGL